MNNYSQLARQSLSHWLETKQKLGSPELMGTRAGCFVSLHTPAGELRGCIGTIEPVRDDLVHEIIENAISAGTRDPRFPPVTADELSRLVMEVSVLGEPEPIEGTHQLDPKRYGLILRCGNRRGVLLPDLAGVDTVAYQMEIVRKKARIGPLEPVEMWRFQVEKYGESTN